MLILLGNALGGTDTNRDFVAGERFTIADITALVAIDIGGHLAEIRIPRELSHLARSYDNVSNRPSARA